MRLFTTCKGKALANEDTIESTAIGNTVVRLYTNGDVDCDYNYCVSITVKGKKVETLEYEERSSAVNDYRMLTRVIRASHSK